MKQTGCGNCGGSGWRHSVRKIGGVDYDFSAPCSCRAPAPSPVRRDGKMASVAESMEEVVW